MARTRNINRKAFQRRAEEFQELATKIVRKYISRSAFVYRGIVLGSDMNNIPRHTRLSPPRETSTRDVKHQ